MPLVSVLMPSFNSRNTVERAIDSALLQTHADVEIVVIDDVSTDGSAEFIEARYRDEPRVRLFRQDRNGGPSRARNAAIAHSRGEWLALLDSDDAWLPDRLETLLSAAGDVALIADNLVCYDPIVMRTTGPYYPRTFAGDARLTDFLRSVEDFDFGRLKPLMNADFLRRNQIRYDETLRRGEDLVLYLTCMLKQGTFRVLGYSGYVYTTPFSELTKQASPHSRTTYHLEGLGDVIAGLPAKLGAALSPEDSRAIRWRARHCRDSELWYHFKTAIDQRHYRAALSMLSGSTLLYRKILERGALQLYWKLTGKRGSVPPVQSARGDRPA